MTQPRARTDDIVELTQQLHAFIGHLDERRYDALARMFVPQGRWLRQGRWLEGREAILDAMAARPATMRVRHIISNVQVAMEGENAARVTAYMTAYRQLEGGTPALFSVSRVENLFQGQDGHWVLAEQQLLREFEFGETP